jgi:hypothetical protein
MRCDLPARAARRKTGTMTRLDTFEQSLALAQPPTACLPLLQALWWVRRGDWDRAHALIQDLPGRDAAHLHAYLHRLEGDHANAAYWYRQAGEAVAAVTLEEEWRKLAARWLDPG